ncbi:MAG: hypothetical protein QOI95_73 [Acidimicrobiaceae bacterium]|jgi:hypothetical protein
MGLAERFHGWQARRAQERAEHEARELEQREADEYAAHQQHYEIALREWTADVKTLNDEIDLASTIGWGPSDAAEHGVILKRSETYVGTLTGVSLIQPRVGPSHSRTNYGGVSYQLTSRTRLRTGQYRTTHTPGVESPTLVDDGAVSLTSQRVIFQGANRSIEWQFSRLLGYTHSASDPSTFIQVSNRQRTSGVLYDWTTADWFRFRLGWAISIFNNDLPSLETSLRRELEQLVRPEPPARPKSSSASTPPQTPPSPPVDGTRIRTVASGASIPKTSQPTSTDTSINMEADESRTFHPAENDHFASVDVALREMQVKLRDLNTAAARDELTRVLAIFRQWATGPQDYLGEAAAIACTFCALDLELRGFSRVKEMFQVAGVDIDHTWSTKSPDRWRQRRLLKLPLLAKLMSASANNTELTEASETMCALYLSVAAAAVQVDGEVSQADFEGLKSFATRFKRALDRANVARGSFNNYSDQVLSSLQVGAKATKAASIQKTTG